MPVLAAEHAGRGRAQAPAMPPPVAGSPIQRAPMTRLMWPCATRTTGPAGPVLARLPGPGRGPGRREPLTCSARLAAGRTARPDRPARVALAGSGPRSGPRSRRSPTRRGRDRSRRPQPGELGGLLRARCRGLHSTSAGCSAAKTGRSARGLRPSDVGQLDVGASGVLARPAPLGLAVADQPDLGAVVRPTLGRLTAVGIAPDRCRRTQAAFLVSQKIVSISAIRSSSF